MQRILTDFIIALRNAGVRVSVSESIDAANALSFIGYENRDLLKISLAAALAKTLHEKEIFNTCFDRFFSFDDITNTLSDEFPDSSDGFPAEMSSLTEMLLAGDQSGILTSLMEAARTVELSKMEYFTQKNGFTRRILQHMDLEGLERDIADLAGIDDESIQFRAGALRDARTVLFDQVRNYVDRSYELFTKTARHNVIESYLKNLPLSSIEKRDYYSMHLIIQKMVKRLNDIHSRKKKNFRHGQLDFKKTLRKNITYGGPLFEIAWKTKKIDRPDIVVLCDVSRSVRMVVRFFLLFLYSLNETIVKIRSFIFCNNLIEVSSVFDRHTVEEAVEILQTGEGLDIGLSRTNYGEALCDFKAMYMDTVSAKTTVIILGDGRNNYFEPEIQILRLIHERAKRLIWLNPETRPFWGTGDSEMHHYGTLCDLVRECNTLNHLERIISDIL